MLNFFLTFCQNYLPCEHFQEFFPVNKPPVSPGLQVRGSFKEGLSKAKFLKFNNSRPISQCWTLSAQYYPRQLAWRKHTNSR